MLNFTVDSRFESVYDWYLHAIGFVVFPLNLFTYYLIWTKTAKHSRTYRYYVLHMQFWSTIFDLQLGVLFMPMPLFPLVGAYCNGILCRVGVPIHYLIVVTSLLLGLIFYSMGISILFRYQLILPEGHWLRIRKANLSLIFFLFLISVLVPAATLLFSTSDTSACVKYLSVNHPCMLWITKKHNWVVYDTHEFRIVCTFVVSSMLSLIYLVLYFCISIHLYRGISRVTIMSLRTHNLHKHIVRVLIAQGCIFTTFIVVPILSLSLTSITQRFPHEVNLSLFAMTMLYSWTHSSALILTTPSYRRVLSDRFQWSKSVKPLLKNNIESELLG